jgi:hypothetical protein
MHSVAERKTGLEKTKIGKGKFRPALILGFRKKKVSVLSEASRLLKSSVRFS